MKFLPKQQVSAFVSHSLFAVVLGKGSLESVAEVDEIFLVVVTAPTTRVDLSWSEFVFHHRPEPLPPRCMFAWSFRPPNIVPLVAPVT
jgi:hypothetical protein